MFKACTTLPRATVPCNESPSWRLEGPGLAIAGLRIEPIRSFTGRLPGSTRSRLPTGGAPFALGCIDSDDRVFQSIDAQLATRNRGLSCSERSSVLEGTLT